MCVKKVEQIYTECMFVAADIRFKLRVTQKAQTTKPINGRLFKDHALQARYSI